MKKKLIVLMLSMSMTAALVSGCGSTAETAVESTATETVQETATEAETADAESDQEAADKVAALIDRDSLLPYLINIICFLHILQILAVPLLFFHTVLYL